jgi:hypothetical protein
MIEEQNTLLQGQHWHVVHTKPRAEARALENLERQGFEVFSAHDHLAEGAPGQAGQCD